MGIIALGYEGVLPFAAVIRRVPDLRCSVDSHDVGRFERPAHYGVLVEHEEEIVAVLRQAEGDRLQPSAIRMGGDVAIFDSTRITRAAEAALLVNRPTPEGDPDPAFGIDTDGRVVVGACSCRLCDLLLRPRAAGIRQIEQPAPRQPCCADDVKVPGIVRR